MKKHRLHDIVLGMVIMALVMGLAIPALATTVKTIEANYMDIKLVVDGVPITPKDANGNVIEPFISQGTTYLPVRAIGEALGKNVKWDGETKTVYIGEIPGQVNYLVDVCPPYETKDYTEYHSAKAEFFKMSGKDYSNGFRLRDGTHKAYAIINLNGEYSSLDCLIGHVDGSKMCDGVLRVYLDGEFSQEFEIKAEGLPQKVSIPLKHAMQLKIFYTADNRNDYYSECGIANAILE